MRDETRPTRLHPKASQAKATTSVAPSTSSKQQASSGHPTPHLQHPPALPVINWSLIGQQAPVMLDTPADSLPEADVVIITWAGSEWAAMEHVFCASSQTMPYSDKSESTWDGWQKYDKDLPSYSGGDWYYWGYCRLIQIQGRKILLFKSNTHLDWPGESYLEDLITRIIEDVKPSLIMSIGTAGGARPQDHIGTVNVVHAGALYASNEPSSQWPDYSNKWEADWTILNESNFGKLLFPIPTTQADLQALCAAFNKFYKTNYSLSQLNPGNLNMGSPAPLLNNMTPAGTSLLTASTFVVGTTAGTYKSYACIEMDDAVIGKVCESKGVEFGFVRNISDPVQNAQLPSTVQGNWGSLIYNAYGFYTSYNGALAAWAIVSGSSNQK